MGKTVSIPLPVYEKLEKRVRGSEFRSVDDYVVFVLTELLEDESGKAMSAADEKDVKARLRSLGYMD
jgi:Arc/MetJ-type ribon-helix-helix transcriptional regulator